MTHKIEYHDGQAAQVDAPDVSDDLPARPAMYAPKLPAKKPFALPSLVQTVAISVITFAAFASYEKFAPLEATVAYNIGTFDAAMLEKTKEVETEQEGILRDYVLSVEFHNQLELQQYKVVSESISNYTTTLYDRSKIGLEHKARLEQQGQAALLTQVQAENASNMGIGTGAKMFGEIFGLFSPEMGYSATSYGNRLHAEARERLEAVAAQNFSVSMSDWDLGVPPPSYVQAQLNLIAPLPLPPRPEFRHIKMPAQKDGPAQEAHPQPQPESEPEPEPEPEPVE